MTADDDVVKPFYGSSSPTKKKICVDQGFCQYVGSTYSWTLVLEERFTNTVLLSPVLRPWEGVGFLSESWYWDVC